MKSRSLRLRAERLAELTTADLEQVAGGTVGEAEVVMHTLDPHCFTCQTSIDPHKCAS